MDDLLLLSHDLSYLSGDALAELAAEVVAIERMLMKLIQKLNRDASP